MFYKLMADLVVLFHLVFIVFGLLGGLLLLWRRWALWLHLPTAIWIGVIEFKGWICPLTPLENHLRRASGAAGYEGGFVEHYLIPVIYPENLTRELQMALGGVAIAINLIVYGFVLYKLKKKGRRAG